MLHHDSHVDVVACAIKFKVMEKMTNVKAIAVTKLHCHKNQSKSFLLHKVFSCNKLSACSGSHRALDTPTFLVAFLARKNGRTRKNKTCIRKCTQNIQEQTEW